METFKIDEIIDINKHFDIIFNEVGIIQQKIVEEKINQMEKSLTQLEIELTEIINSKIMIKN